MLIIVNHLILIIQQINNFLVLNEGIIEGINGSVGTAEKILVITFVKQMQNFAYLYITMVVRVTCV